jgi:Spy/CpxP family protein refolding chaperone
MKKLVLLATLALLSLGISLNAQQMRGMNGRGQMMMQGKGMMQPGEMMKQKMGLTDEQSKKFDEIMFAQREKAIERRAEVQKLKLKMQKIAASENVDVNELKKLQNKIAEIHKNQMNARLDAWEKVNKILTPEQQKIWAQKLRMMSSGKFPMKKRGRRGFRGGMMMR